MAITDPARKHEIPRFKKREDRGEIMLSLRRKGLTYKRVKKLLLLTAILVFVSALLIAHFIIDYHAISTQKEKAITAESEASLYGSRLDETVENLDEARIQIRELGYQNSELEKKLGDAGEKIGTLEKNLSSVTSRANYFEGRMKASDALKKLYQDTIKALSTASMNTRIAGSTDFTVAVKDVVFIDESGETTFSINIENEKRDLVQTKVSAEVLQTSEDFEVYFDKTGGNIIRTYEKNFVLGSEGTKTLPVSLECTPEKTGYGKIKITVSGSNTDLTTYLYVFSGS